MNPSKHKMSVLRQIYKLISRNLIPTLSLIEAMVEVDGKMEKMVFVSNNFDWAASSICDLYKTRWAIEVFFQGDQAAFAIAACI